MNGLVTVQQASELLDVSIDTIRRWDKMGLIRSSRDNNNYRFFNIDEIDRLKTKIYQKKTGGFKILKSGKNTKYTVVELFAGAGGTALGFENAGLKHKLLVEIDKNACATLSENMLNTKIVHDDVRNVSFKDIKADIVQGGFPCQAFSYAGRKMGFEDTRGTLFFEMARCVKEIRPRIVVGENVKGLLTHDGGKTLSTILSTLDELGYFVSYRILKSQYHDVPQKRERLVIVATRKDLNIPIFFPKENDYTVSLREAISDCDNTEGMAYTPKKKMVLDMVPEGGYWKDLPDSVKREYMGKSYFQGGGKTGMARRLSWDEPSLTLTCSPAQKQTERCHPEETRPLSVSEYARIQSFPDTWKFKGSTASKYRQIGNAVPVNLAFHMGKCLIGMLEGKFDEKTMTIGQKVDFSNKST